MEPYRPIIDYRVLQLLREGATEVTRETKQSLANLMEWQIAMPSETTSISNAVLRTAQSLAQSFNEAIPKLILPTSAIPKKSVS